MGLRINTNIASLIAQANSQPLLSLSLLRF